MKTINLPSSLMITACVILVTGCQSGEQPPQTASSFNTADEHQEWKMVEREMSPQDRNSRAMRWPSEGYPRQQMMNRDLADIQQLARQQQAIDLDGNGLISEAEFLQPVERRNDRLFLVLDQDGDNLVSAADITALQQERPSRGRRPDRASPSNRPDMQACLANAGMSDDINIMSGSLREWINLNSEETLPLDLAAFTAPSEAARIEQFRSMDTDNSGQLDREERLAEFDRQQARRHARREIMRECMASLREEQPASTN